MRLALQGVFGLRVVPARVSAVDGDCSIPVVAVVAVVAAVAAVAGNLHFFFLPCVSLLFSLGSAAQTGFHGKKWRCMFICNVAVGRAFCTKEMGPLPPERCPPPGYDSVVGEVSFRGEESVFSL